MRRPCWQNPIKGENGKTSLKTPHFAQFLRQEKILSFKILNVFLQLKFFPSLNLNKLERFEIGSAVN